MTEPILRTEGLNKAFGALQVTNNVTLELFRGEIHALIGPNGAGKTTVLAQLSGELSPDSGEIFYESRPITRLAMHRRAKLGIARSFQITAVMAGMSVRQNVMLAVQSRERHHFHFFRDARRDKDLRRKADAYLEQLSLPNNAETVVANLSHGQKRQLELAMALATEPKVLLLDEPMAGMGAAESERMTALIQELKPHYAILLVEHDMDAVFSLAKRISVLVYGEIIATDTPEEVRTNPEVQTAYLGEA